MSRLVNVGEIRQGQDSRDVGLGVASWAVGERAGEETRTVAVAFGRRTLKHEVGPASVRIIRGGIPVIERGLDGNWGVECSGGTLALEVTSADPDHRRGRLRLLVRSVASPENPVLIAVMSGHSLLENHRMDHDRHVWIEAPYEMSHGASKTEVALVTTNERKLSPRSIGVGVAKHDFDFGLGAVEVLPEEFAAIGAGAQLDASTGWCLMPSDEQWTVSSLGWYEPDETGAWSRGRTAQVELVLTATHSPQSVLAVSVIAPSSENPFTVSIFWKDREILSQVMQPGRRAWLSTPFNEVVQGAAGIGSLRIQVDRSTNEFRSRGSNDDRDVGVFVEQIRVLGFDEHFYASAYRDVRRAIRKGSFNSGLDHFLRFGVAEGRDGSRDQS